MAGGELAGEAAEKVAPAGKFRAADQPRNDHHDLGRQQQRQDVQGLLAERVPIRNMRTILETLSEHAPRSLDPMVLQSQVRVALGRQIEKVETWASARCPPSPACSTL